MDLVPMYENGSRASGGANKIAEYVIVFRTG